MFVLFMLFWFGLLLCLMEPVRWVRVATSSISLVMKPARWAKPLLPVQTSLTSQRHYSRSPISDHKTREGIR